MTEVEYVSVPKALLVEVLDDALINCYMAETEFAYTADDHKDFTAQQDKIEQLQKLANTATLPNGG